MALNFRQPHPLPAGPERCGDYRCHNIPLKLKSSQIHVISTDLTTNWTGEHRVEFLDNSVDIDRELAALPEGNHVNRLEKASPKVDQQQYGLSGLVEKGAETTRENGPGEVVFVSEMQFGTDTD